MSKRVETKKRNYVFTPDIVDMLNTQQTISSFHGYTCPNRGDEDHRGHGMLVATIQGWICPYCDYTQTFYVR